MTAVPLTTAYARWFDAQPQPPPMESVPAPEQPWRRRSDMKAHMCRWLAYSGTPVLLERLLYTPVHSLIDQSLHSKLGATTTNGDGFGVGWYGEGDAPALFKSVEPAWNDKNLRELAGHVRSGLVFAHIRAATGTPVQWTNCHPFRHGRWLWMHNGSIAQFQEVKRELQLAVDPSLFSAIEGSTDSETFFYLALTLGLEDDPPAAVARAVGLIEDVGRRHGVEHPIQMTVATTDGTTVWAFRYSSEGKSRSLFYSTKAEHAARALPDLEAIQDLDDEARLVVSEPLRDLPGAWNEVPESSYGVVQPGQDELHPFRAGDMNLAIAVLIVAGVTALAVTAMLLVRRRAPEGSSLPGRRPRRRSVRRAGRRVCHPARLRHLPRLRAVRRGPERHGGGVAPARPAVRDRPVPAR